jgi:DNA-binding CsgD family transcriptional regulator
MNPTTPHQPSEPAEIPVTQSMLCPLLVGREQTLHSLLHLFEQASHNQGNVALISGEAGIGKSRLVREFRTRITGAVTLQSNCYELDQTQPYTPVASLLQRLIDLPLTSTQNMLVAARTAELTRLHQGLSDASATPIGSEQEKQRLLQSLTQRLAQLAQTQPLLIIFEDIHWCDDASLEYLAYLAQQLGNKPILLILTWRSEALTPLLTRCLAAIERTRLATEFNLSALSLTELETMLGLIFQRQHAIRADFLEALHTLTEGNPFFTEEILRSLVAIGDIFVADGRWDRKPLGQLHIPRTVQAAVQQRTTALTPAAHQLLTLAAVIGRRFDFPLLQHLAQKNERTLLQLLRELVAAQLVVESDTDAFVFRHELTRQAVYGSLLTRERRLLHRATVEAMEQIYPEQDSLLTDLAYHCYQGELWQEAMRYATAAGERGQRLYSPVTAIEHYTNALFAARHLNITPPPTLHQARGKMFEMLGGFEAARGDYEQALEIARKLQDKQTEAQGLLDLGFLWTGRDYGQAGLYFQQAVATARTLNDPALLANTLNRIGLWQTHAELPFEGLEHHQEALSLYERAEDMRGIAETLDLLGVTAFMSGDIVLGWHYLGRAIAFSRATGNRAQLATNLLTASIRGGAFLTDTMVLVAVAEDECVRQCEEAIQIAREIHWPATEAYALIMLGHILGARGELARAQDAAQGALSIAKEIDHRMWQLNAHSILGLLYLERFDFANAQHHLEEAQAKGEGLNSLYMQYKIASDLSRVYVAQKQLAQAAQLLHGIITPALPMRTLAQRLIWTANAELLLAQEQFGDALAILDQLILNTRNRTEDTVIPRLWYLRGMALAARQQHNDAIATLQAAAITARHTGDLLAGRRIQSELGKVYQTVGKRMEAQGAFEEARTLAEQLATTLLVEKERKDFYRQATHELPSSAPLSPQKATQRAFNGLTQREREVAMLIAQGKANRAIADALTLSERTIEKHVENIMAKLDVNSRSQIAVWATEKKLNDTP